MPNKNQKAKFASALRNYRSKFLVKKYENLDESATRIMINHFLTEVLGFVQLDEIKTEYAIKGTYADYVIQLQKTKKLVIEVKSIQIDISDQHLRQAVGYAANEGIDWVLLTNGRQFELYKVIFSKPINCKKVFSCNLLDNKELNSSIDLFFLITKTSFESKSIDKFWTKFQNLESTNFAKFLYSIEIVKILRRKLKEKTDITFSDDDIIDAIHKVIVLSVPSTKPKSISPISKKEGKLIQKEIPEASE